MILCFFEFDLICTGIYGVYIWMRIKLFLKIKIFILYVHVPELRLEGEHFFGQVTTLRFLSSITFCKFHCIYLKQSPFKYNFDQRNCSPPQVFFLNLFFGGVDRGWVGGGLCFSITICICDRFRCCMFGVHTLHRYINTGCPSISLSIPPY